MLENIIIKSSIKILLWKWKKNLCYFKDRLENFYNNQLSKYKYDFNKLIQINEYIIIEKRFKDFAKYLITI